MDWLEEISLRDGSQIWQILGNRSFADIESDPRLGRADKLKRIKDVVRKLRYPRLAQTEDSIRARIQELRLHPAIRLTVPAGLEGGRLRVEFEASSQDELKRSMAKLADATGKEAVREIFDLLAGRVPEDE